MKTLWITKALVPNKQKVSVLVNATNGYTDTSINIDRHNVDHMGLCEECGEAVKGKITIVVGGTCTSHVCPDCDDIYTTLERMQWTN